jgi:hypothetical protein
MHSVRVAAGVRGERGSSAFGKDSNDGRAGAATGPAGKCLLEASRNGLFAAGPVGSHRLVARGILGHLSEWP